MFRRILSGANTNAKVALATPKGRLAYWWVTDIAHRAEQQKPRTTPPMTMFCALVSIVVVIDEDRFQLLLRAIFDALNVHAASTDAVGGADHPVLIRSTRADI